MQKKIALSVMAAALLAGGCAQNSVKYGGAAGRATVYEAPNTAGVVAGVGMESQDIISMTDQMMRDMLSNPMLAGRSVPPRIIIDSEYMRNESSSRLNKNMLTDRLRIQLNRAANGRMVFVGRHFSDMVSAERELKRSGVVDGGTIRTTAATAGADYRLGGRITSLDKSQQGSQIRSRYHLVTFEMVDLELGTIVWSGMYEFAKTAQDDIIYR